MQQQVFAALNDPRLTPRRKIQCNTITKNIKDFSHNYDALNRKCASLIAPENPLFQKLKQHLTNVRQQFATESMTRYNQYILKLENDRTLTTDARNTRRTAAQTAYDLAIANYGTTTTTFTEQVTDQENLLNPVTRGTQCQTFIANGIISQAANANALSVISDRICNDFNDIFAVFQRNMDAAYTKVGATIPPP